MTPTVKYGTIVRYTPENTSGFIRPDIDRDDHKEVYFLNRDSRTPYEHTVGDIILREEHFSTGEGYLYLKNHTTSTGDRVVYYETTTSHGPKAHRWTLAKEWDKSMKLLLSRSYYEQPLARAYRFAEDHVSKIVVWEGFFDRLTEAVHMNEPFLQLEGLHFEWRLAHGWKPLEDVRKDYFPTYFPLNKEGSIHSMRMYLALLIERGISIFARDLGKKAGTCWLLYAAIGRTRKSKGAQNLWGLGDRLPSGNPDILRLCYGVGLITNLDPLFLRLLEGYSDGPVQGKHRECAEQMVIKLRSDKPVGLNLPPHVKHEEGAMKHYISLVEKKTGKMQTSLVQSTDLVA